MRGKGEAEYVGEGTVDGAVVGEEFCFLAGCRGDGEVEGAGGADCFLDEVGEGPAAADIRRICGVAVSDTG